MGNWHWVQLGHGARQDRYLGSQVVNTRDTLYIGYLEDSMRRNGVIEPQVRRRVFIQMTVVTAIRLVTPTRVILLHRCRHRIYLQFNISLFLQLLLVPRTPSGAWSSLVINTQETRHIEPAFKLSIATESILPVDTSPLGTYVNVACGPFCKPPAPSLWLAERCF
jgi:hypothetical protein